MSRPPVGILALQGDVREHAAALTACGAEPRPVRRPAELTGLAGLVIPGGESTTIDKLARVFELRDPLVAALRAGLPAFGCCAGMIMLADRVLDAPADQGTFGGLDITVRRNAFGRQVASFETDLEVAGLDGPPFPAVFIRAPWVTDAGPEVEVLARVPSADGAPRIVAVRQGSVLATAFHPELTGDRRLFELFLSRVQGA